MVPSIVDSWAERKSKYSGIVLGSAQKIHARGRDGQCGMILQNEKMECGHATVKKESSKNPVGAKCSVVQSDMYRLLTGELDLIMLSDPSDRKD